MDVFSANNLIKLVKYIAKKIPIIQDWIKERKLDDARKAIENKNLLLFLKWQYGEEKILEKGDCIYPIAIYAASKDQRENIEAVLQMPLDRNEPAIEGFIVNDSEYLEILNSLKKDRGMIHGKDVNTYTYAMKKLIVDDEIKMQCNLGHYFSTFLSCESLEWEIRSNIKKLKGNDAEDFRRFLEQLPLRGDLHAKVDNPVRDGALRSAAIGISTLIAYHNNGSVNLLTKRRAKRGVPLRAGLLHVIPGFMFQPMTDYMDEEYNVTHNIYREYLEELFNFPEPRDKRLHPTHFYSDKRFVYLKSLLDNGEAKIYFTGVAVNLLNLRPEICTLLYITNDEWYAKCKNDPELHWEINEEFTTIHENVAKPEEFIGELKLSSNDSQMIKDASLYPHRTVPAGAGAFWLGVEALRDIIRDKL